MKHLQIHWPQDMREDIQDRREFSDWCEAAASLEKKPEKKRNTKPKEQANEQGKG